MKFVFRILEIRGFKSEGQECSPSEERVFNLTQQDFSSEIEIFLVWFKKAAAAKSGFQVWLQRASPVNLGFKILNALAAVIHYSRCDILR